ncbi:M48 family metalloprotease [Streptomyces termitum]
MIRTADDTGGRPVSAAPCPDCGAATTGGGVYVSWCAACDWNVDPGAPDEEPRGRVERVRRRLARRHGEQLFAELREADGGESAGRGRSGRLATALALAVHGFTFALLAAGIALVVLGEGFHAVLGAVLVLLAVLLRPRFGSLRRAVAHRPVLRRADAPHLFALLDEVAGTVGTAGVSTVAVSTEVNASVESHGVRRRRLLTVGLGLWETLSPQERIALLGHEFGHYAHGDTRHGLVIASAFETLGTWAYALAPRPSESLFDDAANLMTAPFRLAVDGVTHLLDHLTLRQSQRAEYLADGTAARVGGTEAAASVMDRLLCAGVLERALEREAVAGRTRRSGRAAGEDGGPTVWERVARHAAAVPESEYERLRRRGERRGHSVDATHPPTHLRHRMITGRPVREPLLVLDAARAALVDAELDAARRTLARELSKG